MIIDVKISLELDKWSSNDVQFIDDESGHKVICEGDYGVYSFRTNDRMGVMKSIIDRRWYDGIVCSVTSDDEIDELSDYARSIKRLSPLFEEQIQFMDTYEVDFEDSGVEDEVYSNRKVIIGKNILLYNDDLNKLLLGIDFYTDTECLIKNSLPKNIRSKIPNFPRQWVLFSNIKSMDKRTINWLNELNNNELLTHILILNDKY